jgi:putative ABC transport system permease protein
LGIIIGIAAVVGTFALGSIFTGYFTEQFDTEGSNYVMIAASRPNIFHEQQLDIVKNTPGVIAIAPENSAIGVITYGNEQKNFTIMGTNSHLAEIITLPIYDGSFISDNDMYVAVVGKDIAQDSFRSDINIRSTIQITLYNQYTQEHVTETFRVKGILGSDEMNLLTFSQENTMIVIPIHVMQSMTGRDDYPTIYAMTDSRDDMNETTREIRQRLARSLGVSDRDIDNREKIPFRTVNQAQMIEMVNTITNTLTWFLIAIGGISLVVGAVGIMNIMIVTVTERTKEIGTLKALGYSPNDILLLFVTEAIIISLIGGAAGTGLGLFVAYIGALLMGLSMVIPISGVIFGITLSVIIGVLAGAQPAYRAAKMNPVDALRAI